MGLERAGEGNEVRMSATIHCLFTRCHGAQPYNEGQSRSFLRLIAIKTKPRKCMRISSSNNRFYAKQYNDQWWIDFPEQIWTKNLHFLQKPSKCPELSRM